MENTFFAPVGKPVNVLLVDGSTHYGEFAGIINFGGIPAILLKPFEMNKLTHVLLLNNVCGMYYEKDGELKKIDGGLFV